MLFINGMYSLITIKVFLVKNFYIMIFLKGKTVKEKIHPKNPILFGWIWTELSITVQSFFKVVIRNFDTDTQRSISYHFRVNEPLL